MTVRVRFAPSPTGYLHIGGARTALFNWLFARRNNGVFVLRIEDTDQARSTPESVKAIVDGLTWMGIDWDEGPGVGGDHGPYTQMEKIQRYATLAQQLIDAGHAYRDYSTEEELKQARRTFAASKGLKEGDDLRRAGFQYASPWREKSAADAPSGNVPSVVRFKMPKRPGSFGFDDVVLGRIDKPYDDFDDFVLLRKDGIPLYNFSCVVDDHDMAITHVGRGQEHVNSTFQQLMVYEAFGWKPPIFAHMPLILGPDGEKLSKRKHPEADVMLHRNLGILPHALKNFVMRLGWSHGNDETFTLAQLIEYFDFKDLGRASGIWNPGKLTALNEHWLKTLDVDEVSGALLPFLKDEGVAVDSVTDKVRTCVKALRTRAKSLKEMAQAAKPYFGTGVSIDRAAASKHLTAEGKQVLSDVRTFLAQAPQWTHETLEPVVDTIAQARALKKGAVAQPIRVAVTGNTVSPGIGETLEMVGRDEALARIDAALALVL